jgi:hypothetical protein
MNNENLILDCAELRQLAEENPAEIDVIVEMLIEADEELCVEEGLKH